MKKIIIVSLLLFIGLSTNAQEFQGKAEYFSKRIFNKKIGNTDSKAKKEFGPEVEIAFQEALKKATEKKYTLTFNKVASLFEELQQLEKPEAPSSGGITFSVSFSGEGKKYINIKDKESISEDEIFGKEFRIVEPLKKFDWKLVDETKKIGDYDCFKAQLLIPVSDKQIKEYNEFLKKEETKPSLFKMEKPEDKIVTAWYAPSIPLSFGPNNYYGLPGLILEINEVDNIILCSKVTLNTKEKSKIKAPSTGKKVTQDEFDAIQKIKMDSMKDEDGNVKFQTQTPD